jgi:type VI secretion system secreted protein Hcp
MADMFLKLTDISGESMDIDHEDEIEVFDWRWGLDNDASFALRDQGQATPHTTVAHLSIDKVLDNATVPLVQYCAHGKHISEAVLVCRKNTGAKYGEKHTPQGHVDEYWKIELRDVKVLTVKWPGKAPEGTSSRLSISRSCTSTSATKWSRAKARCTARGIFRSASPSKRSSRNSSSVTSDFARRANQ